MSRCHAQCWHMTHCNVVVTSVHLGTPPRTTAATQLVWQQPGAAGVSWPALGNQTAAGGQNLGTLGRNELSKLPNIYSFCTVSCFDKSLLHSPWQGCVSGARRCWWWWVRLAKSRLFWVRSSHSRPGSCYLRLHAHSLPPTKLVLHFKSYLHLSRQIHRMIHKWLEHLIHF